MTKEDVYIIGKFVEDADVGSSFIAASPAMLRQVRPSNIEGEVLASILGDEIVSHTKDRERIAKVFGIELEEVTNGDVAAYYELAMDAGRQDLSREHPELRHWLARTMGYQVVKNPSKYK